MNRLARWLVGLAAGCGGAAGPASQPPAPVDLSGPEAADPTPVPAPDAPPQVQGHYISAAKAGRWYPADAAACAAQVDALLAAAKPLATPPGRPLLLVVPHGGWRFAGAVAAAGFAAVRDVAPETVVLVGLCHQSGRAGLRGCTLLPDGAMETPLGGAVVDAEVAAEIAHALGGVEFQPAAFRDEHSIEVLLPFVQRCWPAARIVPVLLNAAGYDDYFRFALALEAGASGFPRVLLVASTDLAHGASAADTRRVDDTTLAVWSTLDPRMVFWDWRAARDRGTAGLATSLCGADPVIPALWAARRLGGTHLTVVAAGTSADTPHHRPGLRVVGYAAAVVSAHEPSLDLQQRLVAHARAAALAALGHGDSPEPDAVEDLRALAPGGAFVTLKRVGQLHGCIGRMTDRLALGALIAECAASAAHDPRAPTRSLTATEAAELHVEVSLLSRLERIRGPSEIVLGVHGVKVIAGEDDDAPTATFLPQVAPEHGWDHRQLFARLAAKAGLRAIEWGDARTRCYRYTAFVFSG